MKKFALFFACAVMMAACSSKGDEPANPNKVQNNQVKTEKTEGVAITETLIEVDGGAHTQEIAVDANNWYVEAIDMEGDRHEFAEDEALWYKWVRMEKNKGSLKIDIWVNHLEEEDPDYFEVWFAKFDFSTTGPRECSIFVNCDGETYEIKIKQEGLPFEANWPFRLSDEEIALDAQGNPVVVTVSNHFFQIDEVTLDGESTHIELLPHPAGMVPEEMPFNNHAIIGWLTIVREHEVLTVSAEKNDTGRPREFAVCLSAGDYFHWFKGVQAAE